MIDPYLAKVGMAVFYQQPHMRSPEYGTIQSVLQAPHHIHVLFVGDNTAKACRPEDLHWPPDFCKQDRVNVQGQVFDSTETGDIFGANLEDDIPF